MGKKSTNYSTADSGAWMHAADDLFLAKFRGRPCKICGDIRGVHGNRITRSMGHHLLSKERHRRYRYDCDNIIILCPAHHLGSEMSPHSHDGVAQAVFYEWLRLNEEDKYNLMLHRRFHKFENDWTYRDMYKRLGGEVLSKTGKKKDLRPINHAANVRRAECNA